MKQGIIIFAGIVALLVVQPGAVRAEDRNVRDILKYADRARGNLGGIIWDITITADAEGKRETRGLTVKVKKNNTLARYTSPARVSDQMVLMVDRNMWFIRSGLKKPVSLSPRQRSRLSARQSAMDVSSVH